MENDKWKIYGVEASQPRYQASLSLLTPASPLTILSIYKQPEVVILHTSAFILALERVWRNGSAS
ncbi:MAG: hypothetical protein ABR556_11485, partial [Pyrinomonadaceae bacterium]